MTRPLFKIADQVVVSWMGENVSAVITTARTRGLNGRLCKEPVYAVQIAGVTGHPWYEESEITRPDSNPCTRLKAPADVPAGSGAAVSELLGPGAPAAPTTRTGR